MTAHAPAPPFRPTLSIENSAHSGVAAYAGPCAKGRVSPGVLADGLRTVP
jgi:hypothetical protein